MKNAGLYETHVSTKNLSNAVQFYQELQLELAYTVEERRAAFFWLGDPSRKEQMLGIWEVPEDRFTPSHFAFSVSLNDLLEVPAYLARKGIELSPSFGLDASEPIVHPWMPAASFYFKDLDGNSLEYIAVLDQEPKQDLPALHLSKWIELNNSLVR
ncbi:VOC family protein [Bacillus infantis]|uniref:VOC family protein n=1 Tax=Bacillus infantis TaxID=324767 RepID=UPI003CF191B0